LNGCAATHLVYVQESNVGLSVGLGTTGTEKLSILSFDRDVYAIVPKKGKNEDAMSLLSINKVKMSGFRGIKVNEFVAAGTPATDLAADPEKVAELTQKIYGE
jgi:hypothetical protein